MINKCYFTNDILENSLNITLINKKNEAIFSLKKSKSSLHNEISFNIEFNKKIIAYRSPIYTWEKYNNKEVIISTLSTKIIVLENGTHVLSSVNIGAWSIINQNTIKWILKSTELTPIFKYKIDNSRSFKKLFDIDNYQLKLLFSKDEVPEFSRSKVPFSSIICFTDHCDFDTNESLEKQYIYFKKSKIRVSKGFFLNHFSKRKDNSSFENDSELLLKFHKGNHELFYHAITQSLRPKDKAKEEFLNFQPPKYILPTTWVDHGYQPYNFTKKESIELNDEQWANIMYEKGVKNIWTYLDSGTANTGIINQLNPSHFTLKRILKFKKYDFKFIIRTLLFYSGDEKLILNYRKMASLIKTIIYKKSISEIIPLFRVLFATFTFILKTLFFKRKRNQVFKYAKFTPFIFQEKMGNKTFNFFQTVEVTNFEETFSKKNVTLLIKESGAIIVHCYFSSTIKHQKGKLFNNNEITQINKDNFYFIKENIENEKIWNPTINELIKYITELNSLEFYFSKNNILGNNINIPIRYIKYV